MKKTFTNYISNPINSTWSYKIVNGDDMRIEEKNFLSVQPTSINSASSAAPAPPFGLIHFLIRRIGQW